MKKIALFFLMCCMVAQSSVYGLGDAVSQSHSAVRSAHNDKKEGATMYKEALFAGGCFWCMEAPFEKLAGVKRVVSGYAGGEKPHPSYEEVSSGATGHREAVVVAYDPAQISYEQLLKVFWRQIDPTDAGGQFSDRGSQYAAAIFYFNEKEKNIAEQSKKDLAQSGKFEKPIVTEILEAKNFFPAEAYHQDYYKKHPVKYRLYRFGSGRQLFLEKKWNAEEDMGI